MTQFTYKPNNIVVTDRTYLVAIRIIEEHKQGEFNEVNDQKVEDIVQTLIDEDTSILKGTKGAVVEQMAVINGELDFDIDRRTLIARTLDEFLSRLQGAVAATDVPYYDRSRQDLVYCFGDFMRRMKAWIELCPEWEWKK